MIYLGIFICFLAVLSYYRKKGIRAQEDAEDSFWGREHKANHIRRQDISGLPYITIPCDKFPMDICDNPELKECERIFSELSTQKILNLNNQSNTDLKLKYGPSNLETLTECDQNFATLCGTLVSYAECLLSLGYEAEAQSVLEFGISCGCDHSKNYLLLGELYLKQHRESDFDALLARAELLDSPMKASILNRLQNKVDKVFPLK